MFSFDWLHAALDELAVAGLARDPSDAGVRLQLGALAASRGTPFVDASSNDYLGYGCCGSGRTVENGVANGGASLVGAAIAGLGDGESHIVSRETLNSLSTRSDSLTPETSDATACHPFSQPGSGASRLLGGTRPEHAELEQSLATWVGQQESLLFSSGYAANVGLLSSLPGPRDVIFSDALNHASIVDGCQLGKASVVVYPHLDLESLKRLLSNTACHGRRYIITESYFSMDADSPILPELRAIADNFRAALILDEAHALGVFGPKGAGLAANCGVQPDITIGTLGKSVGLQGAFVAAPNPVRSWLWNRARSFVYSTATSPTLAQRTMLHVKHIQRNDAARIHLLHRADQLRSAVSALGLAVPPLSHGPIVPVILGDNHRAIAAARALRSRGILVYPVRPPTVPNGTARIRLTVTSSMSDAAFSHLVDSLAICLSPRSACLRTPEQSH